MAGLWAGTYLGPALVPVVLPLIQLYQVHVILLAQKVNKLVRDHGKESSTPDQSVWHKRAQSNRVFAPRYQRVLDDRIQASASACAR